jgi:hypothetical protein
MSANRFLGLAAAVALTACATTPTVQVTRFHLGQPIPADTIAVPPPPKPVADSLEWQAQADRVLEAFAQAGFRPVPYGQQAAYLVTFTANGEIRPGPPRESPVRVGFGVGSYGRSGGVSVGGSAPVGSPQATYVSMNTLMLQLRRAGNEQVVWEGRAAMQGAGTSGQSLTQAIPVLARAALTNFPGASGQTVNVPVK